MNCQTCGNYCKVPDYNLIAICNNCLSLLEQDIKDQITALTNPTGLTPAVFYDEEEDNFGF